MSLATSEILDRSTTTLAKALAEMVKGEILTDPFTLSMYSTDASIYEIEPILVVHPLDELDVRSCLWFGQRHGVPVIARGAGSGLAGESLGKGIVMDLCVHMNRIIGLDIGRRQVTLQPGVVLDSLNRSLAPYGLRFPVDPSSGNRCTLGGMIANNASGAHSLKYGDTRRNLISARVCFMDGTATNASPVALNSPDYESRKKEEGMSGKINRELPELLKKHAATIAAKKPKTERHRSGYALYDALKDGQFDLSRVIGGSEGTLGVVTQAVVSVEPIPAFVGMAVAWFDSLIDAAKAVVVIRETSPAACELFDECLIALGRESAPQFSHILPEEAKAMLVIEFEGDDNAQITEKISTLETRLKGKCQSLLSVPNPTAQMEFWAVRAAATPLLFRRKDKLQPVPVVEDGAVPVEKLPLYLEKATKVFEKYKLEWEAYAHAGTGLVHIRPMMNLRTKAHVDILEKVAGEIHAIVWECGGTISGEHAEGLVRSQWLEKEAGKDLYAVYKEVKSLFDPSGLLNPNKKITADAHLMLKNLRFGAEYSFSTGERPKRSAIDPNQAANYRMFKPQSSVRTENTVEGFAANPLELHYHGVSPLKWTGSEMADEVERCNGCGHCRTTGPEEDMCPRFKYERVEDASPRAKANVLRRMMTGRQQKGAFNSDELNEIMDTCFNCKLCHDDCPSGVNIPKIVLEARARYNQSHGLPIDKWIFTQAERILGTARWVAPIFNSVSEMAVVRWLIEKTTGIDRRRPFPKIATYSLRRRFTPSLQSSRPRVVLYLDLFEKYVAPEVAQAAIDVLEHNGVEVEIPDVPWTNMPALTHGAVLESRRHVAKVAGLLAPFAIQDIPILTLDASACLCLQEEFLTYVDSPETRAVSRHTLDITEFLWNLNVLKKLNTDFQRVEKVFGYHQACHQKALKIGSPGLELLKQIPALKIVEIDQGCCGNPVEWGVLKKNYDESMWIGGGVFRELNSARHQIESAVTESYCCRLQIQHGAAKPTLHPVQILAAAYGYAMAEANTPGYVRPEPQPEPEHHTNEHLVHTETEESHAAEGGEGHGENEHAGDGHSDHDSHDADSGEYANGGSHDGEDSTETAHPHAEEHADAH